MFYQGVRRNALPPFLYVFTRFSRFYFFGQKSGRPILGYFSNMQLRAAISFYKSISLLEVTRIKRLAGGNWRFILLRRSEAFHFAEAKHPASSSAQPQAARRQKSRCPISNFREYCTILFIFYSWRISNLTRWFSRNFYPGGSARHSNLRAKDRSNLGSSK